MGLKVQVLIFFETRDLSDRTQVTVINNVSSETTYVVGSLKALSLVLCYSYIEDITRWREDMNFMFEWQQQENIKFITSSQRVMYFLLYGD